MKKTLLFAILALSIYAFAQSKWPSANLHQGKPNPIQHIHGTKDAGFSNISESISPKKAGKVIEKQSVTNPVLIPLIDSVYYWEWDTINVAWELNRKTIKNYNVTEKLESEITKKREGNVWVNSSISTYTYGLNNLQTNWLIQNWEAGNWVNFMQISTTYYASNKVESETTQTWIGGIVSSNKTIWTYYANNNMESRTTQVWMGVVLLSSNKTIWTYYANNNTESEIDQRWNVTDWLNVSKNIYTYDANNNETEKKIQNWNGIAWVDFQLYTNEYDANDNHTRKLLQRRVGEEWEKVSQTFWNYDANNNEVSELEQTWLNNAWVNSFQKTYTYADKNLITELQQSWSGLVWEDITRYTYAYDVNDNRETELEESWNGTDWVNSSQYLYTYDEFIYIRSLSNKWWDNEGVAIESGDSTYFFYHRGGASELKEMKVENMAVYPNPNNGQFRIISNRNIGTIEIYNLLGERVYYDFNVYNRNEINIDLTDYAKGVYIVKTQNKTITFKSKIILQ